jgi:catechol 2,3-dioxygenase
MTTQEQAGTKAPAQPKAISHLVLNVRDLERAHTFYTEMLGFHQVGEIERRKMRFYSGCGGNHHDLALMQLPNAEQAPEPADFQLAKPSVPGLNHVAILMPDEESLMRIWDHLRANGYPVQSRVDHGMSKSVYIMDPDGNGIELMCDLPREAWEADINAALNYVEVLPKD